jgi:four helix bundle protein
MGRSYDLSERLLNFASLISLISDKLPRTFLGNHLSSQLIRSGTSPALHYGEAQAAESRADFIHKMRVCLKELRETFNCLKLIQRNSWIENDLLINCLNENNQLIAIFVKSINTADKGKK